MSDPTASMEDEEQEQDERPLKPDLSAFARFDYDFEHVQHEQQLTFALVSSVLMSATSAGGADFPDGVQQIVNSYAATIDLVTIEIRGIPKTDAPNTILPPNTRDPANAANSPLNHKSDDIINILVPRAAFQWALPSEELLFPTLTEAVTRLHPAATKYELQLSMPTKPMPSIIKYVIHQCNSRNNFRIPKPLRSKNLSDVMPDAWLASWFGRMEKQELYDLILGASSLGFADLLEYGCVTVASLIKGQPLEQIKLILDPKETQFSPPECSDRPEQSAETSCSKKQRRQ